MTVLEVLRAAAKPMTYAEIYAIGNGWLNIDFVWRELKRLVAERKIVERNDGKSPYTYEVKR